MVRKKWLSEREALAEERDARRRVRVAVLARTAAGSRPSAEDRLPKLNENQLGGDGGAGGCRVGGCAVRGVEGAAGAARGAGVFAGDAGEARVGGD